MRFKTLMTVKAIVCLGFGLLLLLVPGCEEDTAEQICEADFTTPSSTVSKFEKWKIPSFFRGFNISYYCSEGDCYKSQEDFDALKETGANLAQINVYGEGFRDVSSPYDINQAGKERIICMASYAHNSGLYYTIAVREGPGRYDCAKDKVSPVWSNRQIQVKYGLMLKEIAAEFMSDSLFVGLVLTVEPDPLTSDWDNVIELKSALQSQEIDMYSINKLWIDEIRTVAMDLPLMVQSVEYSNPEFWGDDLFLQKQNDPFIVYEVHSYEPFAYTHASRMDHETYPYKGWNITTNNNDQIWSKAFYENTIFSHVINFQQKHQVPIYLGEFGMYLPQINGDTYLSDIHSIAVFHGWSFSLWNWRSDKSDKHVGFNYEEFDENSSNSDYWGVVLEMMN